MLSQFSKNSLFLKIEIEDSRCCVLVLRCVYINRTKSLLKARSVHRLHTLERKFSAQIPAVTEVKSVPRILLLKVQMPCILVLESMLIVSIRFISFFRRTQQCVHYFSIVPICHKNNLGMDVSSYKKRVSFYKNFCGC